MRGMIVAHDEQDVRSLSRTTDLDNPRTTNKAQHDPKHEVWGFAEFHSDRVVAKWYGARESNYFMKNWPRPGVRKRRRLWGNHPISREGPLCHKIRHRLHYKEENRLKHRADLISHPLLFSGTAVVSVIIDTRASYKDLLAL
jgi:hypothetical protein